MQIADRLTGHQRWFLNRDSYNLLSTGGAFSPEESPLLALAVILEDADNRIPRLSATPAPQTTDVARRVSAVTTC
jgi:hypothetical protein